RTRRHRRDGNRRSDRALREVGRRRGSEIGKRRVGKASGVPRCAVTKSGAKKKEPTGELRGEVLDVVRTLLAEGRTVDVLGVVGQLVTKNSELTVQNAELEQRRAELERRLNQLLAYRRTNEGISTKQLLLFLNELRHASANDAGEDNGPL